MFKHRGQRTKTKYSWKNAEIEKTSTDAVKLPQPFRTNGLYTCRTAHTWTGIFQVFQNVLIDSEFQKSLKILSFDIVKMRKFLTGKIVGPKSEVAPPRD